MAAALALLALAVAPVAARATATHCCSAWSEGGQPAISPDGRTVYVSDPYATLALRRTDGGALELIDSYDGGGSQVELSPDGRHVYVTGLATYGYSGPNGSGSNINVFTRDPVTGALSHAGRWRLTGGTTLSDIEFLDDRTLYVSDYGRDAIVTVTRDPADGRLDFRGELRGVDGLAGPSGLAIGRGRLYAYQSRQLRSIRSFHIGADGSLTPAADDCDCDAYGDLELSPDGNRLVAGPLGPSTFAVDPSGALEELPGERVITSGGGEFADATVLFGPEGSTVYLADRWDSGLVQMANGPGGLTFTRRYLSGRDGQGLSKPHGMAISPDGRSLYLTSGFTQADFSQGRPAGGVAVFNRDPDSGELTFNSLFTGPIFDGRPHELQGTPPRLEINGGAEYTNDPDVLLGLANLSPSDFQIEVSNDGGFKDAQKLPVDETNTYPWTLASTGPDRLPKTVYVRIIGMSSNGGKPVTDEIVLDETAPTIVSARAASPRKLRIRARDKLSGVSHVQVTRNPRKPGRWRKFTGTAPIPNGRGGVRVRVRDRARNASRWKVAR
ncbi:MAG TPA: hypothetical protein VF712_08715 [Thermoleophilaceae bacterium]